MQQTAAGKSGRKTDYVFEQLKARILSQQIRSGDVVRTEDLSRELQVSSTPAREALMRLCTYGVMRPLPRCGFELIRMTARDFREYNAFHMLLLRCAAPGALQNMDEQAEALLRRYHSSVHPQPQKATEELLQLYMNLSGNALYARMLRQCTETRQLAFAQFTVNRGTPFAYWVNDHLIEALCARDAQALDAALGEMQQHLEQAVEKYEAFLRELELQGK